MNRYTVALFYRIGVAIVYGTGLTAILPLPASLAQTVSFGPATNFTVGMSPVSVAIGDFNGDGKSDLAVSNFMSHTVSILFGDGNGSFGPVTNFAVGLNPSSVAVGDFNADGKPDLAVTSYSNNVVSILLNATPAGSLIPNFLGPTNLAVGAEPYSVAVGDLNGDGKPDLAVANLNSDAVSILLNTTLTGSLTPNFVGPTNFAVGSKPISVAIGDFNGDGKPDLATANYNVTVPFGSIYTVSILLNTTLAGSLTPNFVGPTNFDVEIAPHDVQVGEFNGDGKQDLAVANSATGPASSISILLGTGAGGFAAAPSLGDVDGPRSVAVGDFNEDGKQDLAIANSGSFGGTTVSVFPGNGDGSFEAAAIFTVGTSPQSVKIGDFNGDGKADLAVASTDSNNVSILLNTGAGATTTTTTTTTTMTSTTTTTRTTTTTTRSTTTTTNKKHCSDKNKGKDNDDDDHNRGGHHKGKCKGHNRD